MTDELFILLSDDYLFCLFGRLHHQLVHDQMPDSAKDTMESQVEELKQVAAERLILVVLDGVYECCYVCQSVSSSRFSFYHQTCGMHSMSDRSHASILPPLQSSWWYVEYAMSCLGLLLSCYGLWRFQTTRIKGIMPKGLEVELELLGVKESVELLAAVAEIDADQTPPCCLEIAQLCGRLPVRRSVCVFSCILHGLTRLFCSSA